MLFILLFIREMVEDLLLRDEALTDIEEHSITFHFNKIIDDQLDCRPVHIMDHHLIQLLSRSFSERSA